MKEPTYRKVLFSGNGFDLSFGLPTKYTHFIHAIQNLRKIDNSTTDFSTLNIAQLFSEENFKLGEHFNQKNISFDLSLLKSEAKGESAPIAPLNNIWFDYFIERQKSIPSNWVDFEAEIKIMLNDLIKLYDLEQKHINETGDFLKIIGKEYFLPIDIRSKLELLRVLVLKAPNSPNPPASGYLVQNPLQPIHLPGKSNSYQERIAHKTRIHDIKIIEALYQQLQQLCDVFAYYLKQVCHTLLNHIIPEQLDCSVLAFDEHLTVNYTDTLNLVRCKKNQAPIPTSHIHGTLPSDETPTLSGMGSNIVIGVDNVDQLVETLDTEVLSFTKYFQTLHKKTDAPSFMHDEERVLSSNNTHDRKISITHDRQTKLLLPNHYHVWGHSLHISDKKYIRHLFNLMFTPDEMKGNLNKMTIYFFDQETLANQLRNLLDERMLGSDGKERIERLIAHERLMFEPNPPLIIKNKTHSP